MSEISNEVYSILKKVFPNNVILEEYYVKYKGTRLFFDFYLKDLDCLIEVQGRQHTQFIKHFHGDKDGYIKSKYRDNLKLEYAQEKNTSLVRIYYDEYLTEELIADRIYEAIEESSNE